MTRRRSMVVLLTLILGTATTGLTQGRAAPTLRHVTMPPAARPVAGAPASPVRLDLPIDPTLSYKTLIGADFHSLDYQTPLRFLPSTGGAVWVNQTPTYAEVGLDVPDGAVVSEALFIYQSCGFLFTPPRYYVGAYTPDRGQFTYYLPETEGSHSMTCPTFVDQVTLDAPPTVDNSQNRYVAGFLFKSPTVAQHLVGVRIGYSFP